MILMFCSDAQDPNDFCRLVDSVSDVDRELVVDALKAGKTCRRRRARANCRVCGLQLGSTDLGGHGFQWPERCEHYIVDHGVWTPELDVFLKAIRDNPVELARRLQADKINNLRRSLKGI